MMHRLFVILFSGLWLFGFHIGIAIQRRRAVRKAIDNPLRETNTERADRVVRTIKEGLLLDQPLPMLVAMVSDELRYVREDEQNVGRAFNPPLRRTDAILAALVFGTSYVLLYR